MIIYTYTEIRIYQQKSQLRRLKKDVKASKAQYLHFQESLLITQYVTKHQVKINKMLI